jgi:hypothetical protein
MRIDISTRADTPVAAAQRSANRSTSGTKPGTPGTETGSVRIVSTSASKPRASPIARSRNGGVMSAHATTLPASSASHRWCSA